MALNLLSRIKPHSSPWWKKVSFNQLALQIPRHSYVLDTGKIATEVPSGKLLSNKNVKSACQENEVNNHELTAPHI